MARKATVSVTKMKSFCAPIVSGPLFFFLIIQRHPTPSDEIPEVSGYLTG